MEEREEKTGRQRLKKRLIILDAVVVLLVGAYLTVAYSGIPFIAKWRTLYIETAMTTGSHQWLATLFFPQGVIDEVMDRYYDELAKQRELESHWQKEEQQKQAESEKEQFYQDYWELDSDSVRNYLDSHPELTRYGYDSILIEDLDHELGLYSSEGDPVLVINTANNLIILGLNGNGYVGKMAICKDASQLTLAKSKSYGSYGQQIDSFCKDHNAIVGINASRFRDVGGHGSGGQVVGSLIIDGKEYGNRPKKYGMKFCGMKADNRLYIANYEDIRVAEYRWGMEGVPALIVDGQRALDVSMFMGIQPRACLGQNRQGDVQLLILDGRQPGYSLGATAVDCMDILMRYQCYQAMNLDGGSSAVMYYNGQYITKSCSVSGVGRYSPDAFLLKRVK
ncbi:MAG: phosphodiester glycosidase family protein [Lachnospiraceae bacterium]